MRISGQGNTDHLAKLLLGVQEAGGPASAQGAGQKAPGRDQVRISEQAKELQRVRALTEQPDSSRAERIERIRQALDGGTYDVSGRAVGDALLKQVLTDSVL
jgi:negative regulator of flagellin synthesis FlgM